jgi:hypothetical protein
MQLLRGSHPTAQTFIRQTTCGQLNMNTYSRKKGQKNSARSDNGGGSGWSEEGKQYFDF